MIEVSRTLNLVLDQKYVKLQHQFSNDTSRKSFDLVLTMILIFEKIKQFQS